MDLIGLLSLKNHLQHHHGRAIRTIFRWANDCKPLPTNSTLSSPIIEVGVEYLQIILFPLTIINCWSCCCCNLGKVDRIHWWMNIPLNINNDPFDPFSIRSKWWIANRKSWFFLPDNPFCRYFLLCECDIFFQKKRRDNQVGYSKRQDKDNLFLWTIFEYFMHSQSQQIHIYFILSCWTRENFKRNRLKRKDRKRAKEIELKWSCLSWSRAYEIESKWLYQNVMRVRQCVSTQCLFM